MFYIYEAIDTRDGDNRIGLCKEASLAGRLVAGKGKNGGDGETKEHIIWTSVDEVPEDVRIDMFHRESILTKIKKCEDMLQRLHRQVPDAERQRRISESILRLQT